MRDALDLARIVEAQAKRLAILEHSVGVMMVLFETLRMRGQLDPRAQAHRRLVERLKEHRPMTHDVESAPSPGECILKDALHVLPGYFVPERSKTWRDLPAMF